MCYTLKSVRAAHSEPCLAQSMGELMTRLYQSLEEVAINAKDIEYLKMREIASQLRAEGYEVTENPQGVDQGFDLIAIKGGEKIAVEVKLNNRLPQESDSIKALRKQALDSGYDEFRLVLVSLPDEVEVSIQKFQPELLRYLQENLSNLLVGTSLAAYPNVQLLEIHGLKVESVDVMMDGIDVLGEGILKFLIEYYETKKGAFWSAGFPPRSSEQLVTWEADLPFSFSVTLDHALRVSSARRITIDTSMIE